MAAEPAVRLVPLRGDHAAELFDVLAEPSLYRHLDDAPPPSLAWLVERFDALARGAPPELDEVWLNWTIVDPAGDLVGTTQATVRRDAPTSVAYVLGVGAQGRGLARAAVGQMLDDLAAHHGVDEVQAEIAPENDRSIRLVESLGFTPAGSIGSDRRFVRRLPR